MKQTQLMVNTDSNQSTHEPSTDEVWIQETDFALKIHRKL